MTAIDDSRMTLLDRIVELVHGAGGELTDPDNNVYGQIAARIGVKDVAVIHQACGALVSKGLLIRAQGRAAGRFVRLTDKGSRVAADLPRPATAGPRTAAPPKVALFRLEPIDREVVERIPPSGRVSFGAAVIEEFVASGHEAVRVVVVGKGPKHLRSALDTEIRRRKLRDRLLTRAYGGDVYLMRRDVEMRVVGGRS